MDAVETKMPTTLGGVTLLEHKLIEGIRKALKAVLSTADDAGFLCDKATVLGAAIKEDPVSKMQ